MKKYRYPLVTLYGSNYISNDWTVPCMESWKKLKNLSSSETYVIPDKPLSDNEKSFFARMAFNVMEEDKEITSFLKTYPALKEIRHKDPTWKKIIDSYILFRNAEKIIIIDTDVYIVDDIFLPLVNFDIVYMREDIPAYRGNWRMVINERMVPALNAGLIIVNPKIIDFGYLEQVVTKYLKNSKKLWWSEQAAWSCLAGKSEKRFLFSGKQVRVTSGMKQRSVNQIIKNKYNYYGKKNLIQKDEDFFELLDGASILHFAGPGKYMFKKSVKYLSSKLKRIEIVSISIEFENTLTTLDKFFIGLRLFLKG